MTLDEICSLVRRGVVSAWLSPSGECVNWTAHGSGLAPVIDAAMKDNRKLIERLLKNSDTRLCVDIKAHWPRYKQMPSGWFACPACHEQRRDLAEYSRARWQAEREPAIL